MNRFEDENLESEKEIYYKKCSKCKIEKNIDEFHKNKRFKDGKNSICKICINKKRIENQKLSKLQFGTKICFKCKEKKDIKQFSIDRQKDPYKRQIRKDICKACAMRKSFESIDEKMCYRCKEIKSIINFRKNGKYFNGDKCFSTYCRECINIIEEEYRRKKNKRISKDYIAIGNFKKCTMCEEVKNIDSFSNDKQKRDGKRPSCKECNKERTKEYRKSISEKMKKYHKEYNIKNKERIRKKERIRIKKKLINDIGFRIERIVSSSIRNNLRKHKGSKNGESFIRYLPYSIQDLKQHLESQFESWMSWDNYGGRLNDGKKTWWIDHIIPQSILPYDSMEHPNFKIVWSLGNLRPLKAEDNFLKYDKIEYNNVSFHEDDRAQRLFFDFKEIEGQINISYVDCNGQISAWHGHDYDDYFCCVKGAFKIGLAFPVKEIKNNIIENTYKVEFLYLSDKNFKSLRIPAGVFHGYKSLKNDSIMLYYLQKKFNKKDIVNLPVGYFNESWDIENK